MRALRATATVLTLVAALIVPGAPSAGAADVFHTSFRGGIAFASWTTCPTRCSSSFARMMTSTRLRPVASDVCPMSTWQTLARSGHGRQVAEAKCQGVLSSMAML